MAKKKIKSTTKKNEKKPGRRDNINGARFYKWVVEFEVSATWVADGFDLDDDRVIAAPNPDYVARQQGFESAEAPGFKDES